MIHRLFFLKYVIVCSLVLISMRSYATTGQECTNIKSNTYRLACFDEVFKTPIESTDTFEQKIKTRPPKLINEIFALTQNSTESNQRQSGSHHLQLALASRDKNAAIYIMCKDNITRYQIALKDPVTHDVVRVETDDLDSTRRVTNIKWQRAQNGYLLDVGRGLYAIKQIKKILNLNAFEIRLIEEKRSFVFYNDDLAPGVTPIREECGW